MNMVIFGIHVRFVRGRLGLLQILRHDKEYARNKQTGNAITPVTNQEISGAQAKMRNGGFQQRKNQTQNRGYRIVQIGKILEKRDRIDANSKEYYPKEKLVVKIM